MKHLKKSLRLFSVLLAVCVLAYAVPHLTLNVLAAEAGTSLHFAEHGLNAYRDGWLYIGGNKGQVVDGRRSSDCAGLLYAYFSDNKMATPMGGATSQVTYNCAFSGDLYEGLPRIHGLAVTAPDYRDPYTGIYGHIGIYTGNGMAADNSSYGVNMRYEPIASNSSWNAWHVFDNGLKYPKSGWYAMDGAMYHYTDYQYDINTEVDGFSIGEDGIARDGEGTPIPVTEDLGNDGYVSASEVAAHLRTLGYDGKDDTAELVGMGTGEEDGKYNGKVTGNGVNLRSQPNTDSSVVTVLSRGTRLNILATVEGQAIPYQGKTSNKWYQVEDFRGRQGYLSIWYAEFTGGSSELLAPTITCEDGYVTLSTATEGADLFYTIDGEEPTAESTPYTGVIYQVGCTYRAIAVKDGKTSPVTTATVLSNNEIFTDFTSGAWYFDTVNQAVSSGLFTGTGTGIFSPTKEMSRAMVVTILYRMAGEPDVSGYIADTRLFSDVNTSSWYSNAVYWAKQQGITSGTTSTTFSPSKAIRREELITMLWKYAGSPSSGSSLSGFVDENQVSSFAKDAVGWAVGRGIVSGKDGGKLDPRGIANRAQGAQILMKYLY